MWRVMRYVAAAREASTRARYGTGATVTPFVVEWTDGLRTVSRSCLRIVSCTAGCTAQRGGHAAMVTADSDDFLAAAARSLTAGFRDLLVAAVCGAPSHVVLHS